MKAGDNTALVKNRIQESIEIKNLILNDNEMVNKICAISDLIADTLNKGGKLILAGNGGSASDCLHIAGEIVGRFQRERKPYSAIALNADVVSMTAIANDYGYDEVFSRQLEGHLRVGDVFIGISTSGNSESINKAVTSTKKLGGISVGLTGKSGGKLATIADYAVVVPSEVTARIQEAHLVIYHIFCELVENKLFDLEKAVEGNRHEA